MMHNLLFYPMEKSDAFVTEVIWRAMYNKAFKEFGDDEQARLQADKFCLSIMADKSAGNKGKLYASTVGGLLGQFTQEGVNNVSFMLRDMMPYLGMDKASGKPADIRGIIKALTAFILMSLGNRGINAVVGGNAAIDPIGSAAKAIGNAKEGDSFSDIAKDFGSNMLQTINPIENMTSGNLLETPVPSAISNTFNNLTESAMYMIRRSMKG